MRPGDPETGGRGMDETPAGGPEPSRVRQANRRSRNRPLSGGVGAILVVDLLALMIVLASAPAAWLWLDSSRPSPIAAGGAATPGILQGSPAPGGSVAASGGPGASAAASNAAVSRPSPKLAYGDGTWVPTEALPHAEWGAGSTVLDDCRLLVAGGAYNSSSASATDSVTIYDPATGHWSAATHMLQPRAYPMVVTLSDGSVLVAGGSRNLQPLDTAERYYQDGTWVAAGRLNFPRTQGTLTLLGDGRVLATGGGVEGSPGWAATASAEIFDPKTGLWSPVAPMSVARAFQTATLLENGDVLVAGGATTYNGTRGTVANTAEVYNLRSNTWRSASSMSVARYAHATARLPDGRVLVAGGWALTTNTDPSLASAEIYDPASNVWTPTGSLNDARGSLVMAALPDGRLLAVAGVDPSYHVLASTEIYGSKLGTWQRTGKLPVALERPAIGTLPDGRVVVAGGAVDAGAGNVTAVCSIFSAPPPS
ncbi:MAG: Kelch repeat-containing protein [Candidatus Limnocylindrales bacterium]